MGLLSALNPFNSVRLANAAIELTAETSVVPSYDGTYSQYDTIPVSILEAFGINTDLSDETITRKQAMGIPAVAKGRATIAGTLGTLPLIQIRSRAGNSPERITRPLLTKPDPLTTLPYVLTWTVDDLMFYGVSWWLVIERDSLGFPTQARRVQPGLLSFDYQKGKAYLNGRDVTANLLRFDGPSEGVLNSGGRALKTALMLEQAVRRYATMDIPLGYFQDTQGQLSNPTEMLDSWQTARNARTTAYVPYGLEYKTPGLNAEQIQLAAARDHVNADIARLLNLPALYVNAPSGDSLTYATSESNRRELVDLTLRPYIVAIEARLSQNDVTPNGSVVKVDTSEFLRGDTNQVLSAAASAIGSGVMTIDEVRTQWLNLPPLGDSNE